MSSFQSRESGVEGRGPEDGVPSHSGAAAQAVPREVSSGSFWVLLGIILFAAAILWLLQARRPKPPDQYVGQSLPPLHAAGWLNTEKPLSTDDLRGKVVLVDYWATWCGPCVRGIPQLVAFHKKYRDAGVLIVGLTSENGPDVQLVKNFAETRGMNWPIGYGAGLTMQLVGVEGIPTYMLFDRTGTSVWGGHSLDGVEQAAIAALAKEK